MAGPYTMIETLRDFVEKAGSLRIDYMVTGSFAMSAFGEIRYTRDIDIVIQLPESLAKTFAELFVNDGYYVSDSSLRQAISRKSMFNIVSLKDGAKIDCIIQKDTEFARVSFSRRQLVSVSGVDFWTTTKEDLIIAKLNWARDSHSEMQIRDIANLTSNEYDSVYVDDWITRLGLNEIWSKVREWKIRRDTSES